MKTFFTLTASLLIFSLGNAQQTNPQDLQSTSVVGIEFQPVNSQISITGENIIPDPQRSGPGIGHVVLAIPPNDNCANAIALTINAPCVTGTNKESTVQAGENTGCQGAITKSVWYSFVASATSLYVEVERTASSGCYLSSAVYSGACLPALSLSCEDAAFGPNLNIHNLTGLTIGATYYVQVGYTAGAFCGNNNLATTGADFCIKVGRPVTCATCNSTCGPMCIFATTPTVAQVTATCPQYVLQSRLNANQIRTQCYTFTAVATSLSMQMIINSTGCAAGNVLTFDWSLYPSNCSGVIQSGNLANLNANGLTIGASYVLCYTWTAACQHNSVYPYVVASAPLPVELISFEGKSNEQYVQLKWSTASETNNSYYAIQRSENGADFSEIGKVNGAGTSTNTHEYKFIDASPLYGISYYRLVQIDYDNTASISGNIAIKFLNKYNVSIDKNPVTDILTLAFDSELELPVTVKIINQFGKTIINHPAIIPEGFDELVLPVAAFSKGVYYVQIESAGTTEWLKFIKM